VIDDADDLAAIGQNDLILVAVGMLDADDDAEELDLGFAVEIGTDLVTERLSDCHRRVTLVWYDNSRQKGDSLKWKS